MEVKAWIQMGCERREVTFEVSEAEMREVGADGLEMYIEEAVLDWIECRYGWGWSCALMRNDFGHMEDGESPGLVRTNLVLNPRTVRRLVPLVGFGHRPPGALEGRQQLGRFKEGWQ